MVAEVENENTHVGEETSPKMKIVNGLTKKVSGDVFDEWKTLAGHSFTAGFVVESLRSNDEVYKKLHKNRPIKDVTASDISKGKGFASEILRCIIYFVDSTSESDIYTTVLKIPGVESIAAVVEGGENKSLADNENFVKQFCQVHQIEVDFYEHICKALDIPIPRVFKTLPWKLGEAEGLIHMEDMTGKGKPSDIGGVLTVPQIKEIVRNLAHMHRMCLTSEDEEFHSWKGKHNANLYNLISMCNIFNDPTVFLEICGDKDFFEPLLNKYHKFAINPEFIKYASLQSWKDLKMPSVIVHGDFHSGNMMWKLDKNGEIINEIAAFYDWQIYHEGSPVTDLTRLITFCLDGGTRRQVEEFIFDFYHDQLEKEMNEVGKHCPYTVDQLKKAYKYVYLTQCYTLVIMPKILNEVFKDECPNVKQAKMDAAFLRSKHALEDMDRLLTGEMKDLYEKYGK